MDYKKETIDVYDNFPEHFDEKFNGVCQAGVCVDDEN